MIMKKKQLLMATLVIALGAAVAVNWYYTENPINTTEPTDYSEISGNLGDSISVDAQTENEDENVQSVMANGSFFANERLKRDEVYDGIIDDVEEIAAAENLNDEQSNKITQLLDKYIRNMKVQSDTESLITAKTGSDCIVVINEEVCQVILEKNTLNDKVILQITEIIEKNTNISAKKMTIIEAN